MPNLTPAPPPAAVFVLPPEMTPERLEAAARTADLEALDAIAADRSRPDRERRRARRLAVRFRRARRGFNPGAAPRRTEAQMRTDSAPTAYRPEPGSTWTCAGCGWAGNDHCASECGVCRCPVSTETGR